MAYFTKNEDGTFAEITEELVPATQLKEIKAKNTELRNTNTNLLKANEGLSAFADVLDGVQNITPDSLVKKIEEKAATKAEKMVTEMRAKFTDEVKALNEQLTGTSGQLSKLVLGQEVQKAGVKHGVVPTAFDDVLRRAETEFVVKEGKVVFKAEVLDSNGQQMTVDTWLAETIKAAPHLAVTPRGPATKQNSGVNRHAGVNNGEKRSASDLLVSGLSNIKPGSKSLI